MVDVSDVPTSPTKMVLMLAARRVAVAAGTLLVTHGLAQANDPGMAGFTEVLTGALVVGAEFGLEWWRKNGMVMISAQLARLKGIPLPHEPPPPPTVISTPAGPPVTVQIKSASA